ncbi:MAG TPA: hypothetical protein VKT78_03060 [Fimbriimonadaceae bacterium]|nr:hypothetical protein [Fimbriimonadaceae bacterium]
MHVPLLNAFGERFYANGFRLSKDSKPKQTVPGWATLGATGTTSRGQGSAVPISYAVDEVASYGFLDTMRLLYHFEYQPIVHQNYIYGLEPVGKQATVQIGEIGLLGQYDPRLDVSISRPVYLQPAGSGSLGNGKNGPFAPGANAYGARVVASLTGPSAMPFTDGWKVAATVPFSNEAPCGLQPTFAKDPTGAFVELFRRTGMNSYGANSFIGRDGRRYFGVVGQFRSKKVMFEGGAADARFNGAESRLGSLSAVYVPRFNLALGLRVDDQDGFVNYVPTASWLIGSPTTGFRLTSEATITKGVAPTLLFQAEFKL